MHKYHSHISYNPLQKLTAEHIDKDVNVVILAPTSSGKTICAEQFIFPVLDQGKRAIYLSPLKALTNEKLQIWEKLPYTIVAITSDHYKQHHVITEKLVLMTTEALDSKTRGVKAWLKNVGVLVADEAHIIGMPGRGDAFEVGLTRFAAINSSARIIFLSATIPNASAFAKWLSTLNGKESVVVETSWRPVKQTHHLIKADDFETAFDNKSREISAKVLAENPDKQTLIFVHTIRKGKMLAEHLKIPFHYSKVTLENRRRLEDSFMAKTMNAMVSTSTLAYGINLPADIGIIVGGHRGPVMVEPLDIKQMAGRIGRYGLSDEGVIYYVFKQSYADELWSLVADIPAIETVLPKRLYFHIVSLIARENMNAAEVMAFLDKTFAAQSVDMKPMAAEAIDKLIQHNAIKLDNNSLVATRLGKAAAMMYLDPIDLFYLLRNLKEKPMSPSLIGVAFADIPSNRIPTYVPGDIDKPIKMPYGTQTIIATGLRDWLSGRELAPSMRAVIPYYIKDLDRWTTALGICGLDKKYLEMLNVMIAHGVGSELINLVTIRGIGRKRASRLFAHGIKDLNGILAKRDVARNILGNAILKRIVQRAENPDAIYLDF